MGIGQSIKKLRLDSGLTENELAQKVYVYTDLVKAWENGDKEPTDLELSRVAMVLGVNKEDILGYDDTCEALGYDAKCEICSSPINSKEDFVKIYDKIYVESDNVDKNSHRVNKKHILCKNCFNKNLERKKEIYEEKKQSAIENGLRRRLIHFVVSPILGIPFIAFGIWYLSTDLVSGIAFIVAGIYLFCLSGVLILRNVFITERLRCKVKDVSENSIIYFLLLFDLWFNVILLLTVLCMVFYPIAIYRNIKMPELENYEDDIDCPLGISDELKMEELINANRGKY